MSKTTIHTINNRDHIFYDCIDEIFNINLSHQYKHKMLQQDLTDTINLLDTCQINYKNLRNALIPHTDRLEILLLFDTIQISNSWYGKYVMDSILNLISNKLYMESTFSILTGDFIATQNTDQQFLYKILNENLHALKSSHYKHSSQYYLVYINNLTEKQFEEITGLILDGFVGYINVTFDSMLKNYISLILNSRFIKHKKNIILSGDYETNEIQLSAVKHHNPIGYDFERYKFICISMPPRLYSYFLSYKIEGHNIHKNRTDEYLTKLALIADSIKLEKLCVVLDEEKYNYLHNLKLGSLKNSNIHHLTINEFKILIKQKLQNSYIYNLKYEAKSDEYIFSIILEFKTTNTKCICALAYKAPNNDLRVITLY